MYTLYLAAMLYFIGAAAMHAYSGNVTLALLCAALAAGACAIATHFERKAQSNY